MNHAKLLEKSIELLTLLFSKEERLDVTQSFKELLTERHELKATNEELLQQTMQYQDVAEAYRVQVLDMQLQLEVKEKALGEVTQEFNTILSRGDARDWQEKFQRLEYAYKEHIERSSSIMWERLVDMCGLKDVVPGNLEAITEYVHDLLIRFGRTTETLHALTLTEVNTRDWQRILVLMGVEGATLADIVRYIEANCVKVTYEKRQLVAAGPGAV